MFFCAEVRKQYFLNENKKVPYLELCDLSDIRRYIITYCILNISFSNNRIYYVHSPISSKYTGAEVNANTCCVNSSANSILKYFFLIFLRKQAQETICTECLKPIFWEKI